MGTTFCFGVLISTPWPLILDSSGISITDCHENIVGVAS